MGIRMVCEFLPSNYKRKLVEVASVEDLENAGYSKKGAYTAKEKLVISDDRCERLVEVLGDRALPIVEEALHEFEREVERLRRSYGDRNDTKALN